MNENEKIANEFLELFQTKKRRREKKKKRNQKKKIKVEKKRNVVITVNTLSNLS